MNKYGFTVMAFVVASLAVFAAQPSSSPQPISPNAGTMWASGDVMGRSYETTLLLSDVTNAPVWAANQDNPPLSVRKAERLATKSLAGTLGSLNGWKRANDITLCEYLEGQGYWIYQFQFDGPTYQLPNGSTSRSLLTVFVMMNGKVVGPQPWKRK